MIQTGNVGSGSFKDRSRKRATSRMRRSSRLRCTEMFEGDYLISRLPILVGQICMLARTGERMITAVDCTIVRFNPQQDLTPMFFIYYSRQSNDYLSGRSRNDRHNAIQRISRAKLGQIPIPLPPLPEQQRIVGILDEAFDGIATAKANAEKNLQNARALFESYLQSVFTQRGEGWVEKTLSKISNETLTRKSNTSTTRRHKTCTAGNIRSSKLATSATSITGSLITRRLHDEARCLLARANLWLKGTICIAIVGANVAKTGS